MDDKIKDMIRDEVEKIVKNALRSLKKEGKIKGKLPEIELQHPSQMSMGDYATNIALVLGNKNLAEVIAERVREQNSTIIEDARAVSGFVNFFVSKKRLVGELKDIIEENYGSGSTKSSMLGKRKKIVVEYSSPNIAKAFGVGHLRSTIIGQAIYNLYRFLGWNVVGINHIGDWGTPHGKIIYQIVANSIDLDSLTVEQLEKLYVEFNKLAAEKPEIEEGARQWFKKLEDGNPKAREIWEREKEVSLKEFERIYDLLQIHIDKTIGESFYENMMEGIIEECKDKGITKESEGALIVEFHKAKLDQVQLSGEQKAGPGPALGVHALADLPPAMLLKSDGATTYFTRDLAALKYRLKEFKPDVLIYETGVEQELHFRQVFVVARILGWINDEKLVHVAHGFYRLEHGRFKTREGRTVRLEDILNEAIERAKKIVEETETAKSFTRAEKEQIAEAVGIGSVKYNDLSHNPRGDIIFDWEKILNLKGNSAPYIQYTHARCESILRKSEIRNPKSETNSKSNPPAGGQNSKVLSEEEMAILRYIYRFPEVVREAAESFSPNLLCNFVFELSQKFNLFYAEHRVLEAKTKKIRNFRLLLTEAVSEIIYTSLDLLGIEAPDKM